MFTPRFARRFMAAMAAVTLATFLPAASATRAGTVNYGDFETTQVVYHDVHQSGVDIPSGLFVPTTPPVATSVPNPRLTISPDVVIQTDVNKNFDFAYKTSQMGLGVQGKVVTGNQTVRGYALLSTTLHMSGNYQIFAPQGVGEIPGSPLAASIAKVTMAGQYSIRVAGVNWQPYSGGQAVTGSMQITPSDVVSTGPQNSSVSGTWDGTQVINWTDLRRASGVKDTDYITDVAVEVTASVAGASIYSTATTSVTTFSVENTTEAIAPVAVPEPPTIILAGLGVAACVANGFRRRKANRQDGLGDDSDRAAETIAPICLKA